MCMEDIKIKRNTKTKMYRLANDNLVIGGNANRLSIRIVPDAAGTGYVVAPGANTVANSDGGVVRLGYSTRIATGTLSDTIISTLPDDVTLDKVGDILTGQLHLFADDAGVTFIETYLDCPTDKPAGCI